MAWSAGSPVFRAGARWGGVMLLFALALAAGAGIVPLHAIYHRVWIVLLVVGWVLLGLETAWLIAGRLAGPAQERPSVPGVTMLGAILVPAATALGFLYSRDGGNQLVEWCGVPEFKLYRLSGAQYALESNDFLLLVESVLLTVLFVCLWSFVFVLIRPCPGATARGGSDAIHRVIAMSLVMAIAGALWTIRYHHRLRVWGSELEDFRCGFWVPHTCERVESSTGEVRLVFADPERDMVACLQEYRAAYQAERGVASLPDGRLSLLGYGLIRPGGTEIESFWSWDGARISPPFELPDSRDIPCATDGVVFRETPWICQERTEWNTYLLVFDWELEMALPVSARIGFASHSFRPNVPITRPMGFLHRVPSGQQQLWASVPFLPMVPGDAEVELTVRYPETLELACTPVKHASSEDPVVLVLAAERGHRQVSRITHGSYRSTSITLILEPPCRDGEDCSTLVLSAVPVARRRLAMQDDGVPSADEFDVQCVLKDGSEVHAVIREKHAAGMFSFDVGSSLERIDRLRVRVQHEQDLLVFPIQDIRGVPECNRDVRDLLCLRLEEAKVVPTERKGNRLSDLTGGLLAGRVHVRMGPIPATGITGFRGSRAQDSGQERVLHDVTVRQYLDACCRGHWYVSGDTKIFITEFPLQTLLTKIADALQASMP